MNKPITISRETEIPKDSEIIFVADFFAEELIGGAELTSDAIIKASPKKLFKLHSSSLTPMMVIQNSKKIWIFGNYTMVPQQILTLLQQLKVTYYFFEYDFKPCIYRSTKKHELNNKGVCDCHLTGYGKFHANFMTGAKALFWCSEGQRDKFYNLYKDYTGKTVDFIQGSTFYPETILKLRDIRSKKENGDYNKLDRWAILGSASWIKGTEDAIKYCEKNKLSFVILENLSNEDFLIEIAKSKGLVFLPRDIDVGSRITIETKLLGGKTILNDNVLPKFEPWFNSSLEEIEQYFLDGPNRFWRNIFNL